MGIETFLHPIPNICRAFTLIMILEMEMESGGEHTASIENRNAEKKVAKEERGEGSVQGDEQGDKGENSKAAEKKGQNIQDKGKKRKGKNTGSTQSCKPCGDPEDGQHKGSSGDSRSEINERRQSQDSAAKRIGEGGLSTDRPKVVFVDLSECNCQKPLFCSGSGQSYTSTDPLHQTQCKNNCIFIATLICMHIYL